MSEYEGQTRGFKGTDRRAFTAEGDPREPSEEPLAASNADQAESAEQIQARSVASDERFFDLLSLLTTQQASIWASLISSPARRTKTFTRARDEQQALEDVPYQPRTQLVAKAKRSKP